MSRQLSTAEQQQRRKARQIRRRDREEREREQARWKMSAGTAAVILVAAALLSAGIGWVMTPTLMPDADPVTAIVTGALTGGISALLAAAGIVGMLGVKPRWVFISSSLAVGGVMYFAVLDAAGAVPFTRIGWMVCAVVLTAGFLGIGVFGVSVEKSGTRPIVTLAVSAVITATGAVLLGGGLGASGPIFVGLWTVGGRTVDASPADGLAPVAFALFGMIVTTLGVFALAGCGWASIQRRRKGRPVVR
ncbi:hypothetical protein DY023_10940 [Microbacterium bovistercoris]|uniref:Uncharacterized protein n=1 Tax=Microbacterium bovistercoris TaxID=2293570 RepID=A0A371NSG3_9MICO|nr:hypothetical protein [Microbacterium bovistercoris]REJ05094.1 hypothetical protein DY023_10940 [Microbacterium bovistercoris]